MKNYTTQTAALKATTVDTRLLDAKQIDTKKLFINGELFYPSQKKESPNDAMFQMSIIPTPSDEEKGVYFLESTKRNSDGDIMFESEGVLLKGSETEGVLSNGVYVVIQIDYNFAKCIGGNSLNDADERWKHNLARAKFEILNIESSIAE